MTPDQYIEKAKHAMLTGQPNLAMLYMQRGMVILDQRRREHLRGSIAGQFTLLSEDVNKVVEVFVQAWTPALQAAGLVFENFHRQLLEQYQDDFALVSE